MKIIDEAKAEQLANSIALEMDFGAWDVLIDMTEEQIAIVAEESGMETVERLLIGGPDEAIINVVHKEALGYARERSAEMVGKRRTASGRLINNPNPEWAITETTRAKVKRYIVEALKEGDEYDLVGQLEQSAGFSHSRAQLVARTELAMAHGEGRLLSLKASEDAGVKLMKQWITAGDDKVCEAICRENEKQGPIPLDADFKSGDKTVPGHPRCRCDVTPVVID